MPPDQVALNTSKIPVGRLGALKEVPDMIAWIVSTWASFPQVSRSISPEVEPPTN